MQNDRCRREPPERGRVRAPVRMDVSIPGKRTSLPHSSALPLGGSVELHLTATTYPFVLGPEFGQKQGNALPGQEKPDS